MALLPILSYPDPRLHTVARPISDIGEHHQLLIQNMFETMYDSKGIGLAATQVNHHERLIVMDVSEDASAPLVLINPQVIWSSPERVMAAEGCLSVPGFYDGVERSKEISVEFLNEKGLQQSLLAQDLLAICIQHEMDHLEGKVFVEYLSFLKRNRIKTKLLKAQRELERS
jgi:peptide deformylase